MTAHRSILLENMLIGPSDANAGVRDLTPWTDFSWADSLTFLIGVHGVQGAPTSGNLFATFQFGLPGYAGNEYATQVLAPVGPAESVSAYNASFPVVYRKIIRDFGSLCNLHLDGSSLAGGTNPTFQVSINLIQKGA